MRRQILTAKSGISNHAAAGIRDDPCLSKFGTPRTVSVGQQTILDFCVCFFIAPLNITARSRCYKPSAIFLIADGNEFRFARFYIVCEEVPLGDTRKSAHCLRLVGHSVSVQTWPRHGMGCQPRHGRNT